MTVEQLIAELQELPSHLPVYVQLPGELWLVESAEEVSTPPDDGEDWPAYAVVLHITDGVED